jgi:hypothetical protein
MYSVGAPCFSRGKQRFSVAEETWIPITRFSAGLKIQAKVSAENREAADLSTTLQLFALYQGTTLVVP